MLTVAFGAVTAQAKKGLRCNWAAAWGRVGEAFVAAKRDRTGQSHRQKDGALVNCNPVRTLAGQLFCRVTAIF